MAAWTIKQRLVRRLMILFAVLWIAGVSITGFAIHHELEETFDSALREATGQIIPIALHEYSLKASRNPVPALPEAEAISFKSRRGHVHFFLQDRNGTVLVASSGAPADPLPAPRTNGFHNHGDFRYYTRLLPKEGAWIVVAQELHERSEAALGLWLGLASPLLVLLPLAGFAIWRTVGGATEPIQRVSGELEARGGEHLGPIDDAGLPGELAPVIGSINTLLTRLKAALDQERAFAANAAHELRNPIASARAQVQLLASNLVGTADNARAENIASQLGQLGRRIEKMLQMSRAEAGLGHSRERSDLEAVAQLIVDDYRRRPDVGDRMTITSDDEAGCWVAMDIDAVAIVLRNAVENAVGHGSATEPIDVRVRHGHKVSVVNACPAVPGDVLRELKGRFQRGGTPRGAGSGLGLAIVETIMQQAGGFVTLLSPAEGRLDGFEIVLEFPDAL